MSTWRATQQTIELDIAPAAPGTAAHPAPVRPATARSAPRTTPVDTTTRRVGTTPDPAGERGSTATLGARTRAAVALDGGPRDRYWYWLTDWHNQQESARAQHLRPDQPTPTILCYQPTGICMQNPNGHCDWGEMWHYTPPRVTAGHVPVPRRADGSVSCPVCGHPAPRLITWRAGHRAEPVIECPRCAYPPQRYLGAWVNTMPATDAAWYDTPPDQRASRTNPEGTA